MKVRVEYDAYHPRNPVTVMWNDEKGTTKAEAERLARPLEAAPELLELVRLVARVNAATSVTQMAQALLARVEGRPVNE